MNSELLNDIDVSLLVPPEPHILDSDWRFTQETLQGLVDVLPLDGTMLAIGTPSLTRILEGKGCDFLLVDRQPNLGVGAQLCIDVLQSLPVTGNFSSAIVDPPWYPDEFRYWVAWAAHAVGPGGTIFAAIWPNFTRPNARNEKISLWNWISTWAEVELLDLPLRYSVPLFEQIATSAQTEDEPQSSPLIGELIRIKIKRCPELSTLRVSSVVWHRFRFNQYQLALRVDGLERAEISMRMHPLANSWIWPFVSRRAPQMSDINLWSSRNEVATLTGGKLVVTLLQDLALSSETSAYELLTSYAPEFLSWGLPTPPYNEVEVWTHL
ncbi:MAG: hypothetical protein COA34_014920 [Methylophaga sp.]|uniref:hypothetical protein n=1 Tax=Methylophaga sp. TaxID=2024840 RepID=UPI0021726BD5|nr:hypothetical protein [Methylophaga sp.]MBL1459126.1 hypothetical protein [Methylophaga sp.]